MGLTRPDFAMDLLYQIQAAEVLCPKPTDFDGRTPSGGIDEL